MATGASMLGKSKLMADNDERAALRNSSKLVQYGEAERAGDPADVRRTPRGSGRCTDKVPSGAIIFRLTKTIDPSSRIYGSGREVGRRPHRLRRRSGREP